MAITVNNYSLNQPGEAADWSSREFALLSAFAGLMPVSGSRVVSAGEHYHNVLTDANGNIIISNDGTKLTIQGETKLNGSVSATSAVCLQSVYRAPDGGTAGSPVGIVTTNYNVITVSASLGGTYYNLSAGVDGQILHLFNIGLNSVYFNIPDIIILGNTGSTFWWDATNSTWLNLRGSL